LSAHYCPETLATFVSQGTERRRKKAQTKTKSTTQKTNKMSNTGPTKTPEVNRREEVPHSYKTRAPPRHRR